MSNDAPVVKAFPDGHYYSPIPDLDEVRRRHDAIFAVPEELPGIDLGLERQLALLGDLAGAAADAPFGDHPSGDLRYGYVNGFFSPGDALAWFGMLRLRRPPRVIEIGSGWSSAVLLDAIDATPGWTPEVIFVEPNPERLQELVREEDDAELYPLPVQDAPRSLFDSLEPGDVLFIDSTHVARVGSDVNLLLLDVVPRLRPGVLVHVHDIFYPFEYRAHWVYEGRAWNEAYVLRALLVNNSVLRIVWWNDYMAVTRRADVEALIPRWGGGGGSIYLETVAAA
jgi:hypothetical protein